jgi:hypothetical protein
MLLLDEQNDEEVIFIDELAVTLEDLYDKLVTVIIKSGRETKVDLIFGSAVRFSAVTNVRGLLQAVGFSNIRIYYLSRDRTKMAELHFSDEAELTHVNIKKMQKMGSGL